MIANTGKMSIAPESTSPTRSVVITGASSGIGHALALRYAQPGTHLGLLGRDRERLRRVADECRGRGATVDFEAIDVRSRGAMAAWLDAHDRRFPIDLLVANAGVMDGTPVDGEIESADAGYEIVETNVLGILNTPWALIISYNVFTLPLAIMILKNYFDQLPRELEEAAKIDGASRLLTLWLIIVPVAKPGLVAAAVLIFLEAWSEFFYSLVLTNQLTVTPLLAGFQSVQQFNWNSLAAATVMSRVIRLP